MQFDLTADGVHAITATAGTAARRLGWRLRLPHGEWEDLRQDFLLDLLRRLPDYDPDRGSFDAFVHVILTHRSTRIASRVARDRRARGGALLSLDLPLDGDPAPLGERIATKDGLWAWLGQDVSNEARVERGHDVRLVLAHLPEADRQLCSRLASQSVTALARAGFGSRSNIYRRIADLRCSLTAHGLGSCRDDLAAA